MTDEINGFPNFIFMAALILGAIIVIMLCAWMGTVGTAAQEFFKLKDAQCESIIIVDTFTDIRGGFTTYYIVDNNNVSYKMYLSENQELYEWNSIVKGKSHDIKRYNTRAEFC